MANLSDHLSVIFDTLNKSNSIKRFIKKCHFSVIVLLVSTFSLVSAGTTEDDSDSDGLTDTYELKIGSEPYLLDTDGDTVNDAQEIGENSDKPRDSDNDGVVDVLDYDDDNDGLPTFLESKVDSDKDGLLDYLDPDSDNDGIADGEEAGFLNQDKNLDGIDDAFDTNREGAVDNNGDGIDDNVKLPDHNRDGVADYLDAEFQHVKQILVEKNKPKNKAEITVTNSPKSEKIDVTKNTVESAKVVVNETKKIEKKLIKSKDMIINRHTDSDNDGLSNSLEKILGTNHLNRDSDGDKVSDAIEIGLDVNSPQDSDRDGIIDALDDDDDNDGILTKFEDLNKDSTAINDDTDADGVPNYLDANDDGDDFLTKAEGSVADSDGDGILDYLDKNDGMKNQSNASNTMKVTNINEVSTEPEIVVLFDGDAAALIEESENISEDLFSSGIQDNILLSLDNTLKNNVLDEKNIDDGIDDDIDGGDVENKKVAKNTKSKSSSHWDLF